MRWKASGALIVKLYQDNSLVGGEFRPSDECEISIASSSTFKIIANYGNQEVVEKEVKVTLLTYGTNTPRTVSSSENKDDSWNNLSLFTAKPEEFDLRGTVNGVFNELSDRLTDYQRQTSLYSSVI